MLFSIIEIEKIMYSVLLVSQFILVVLLAFFILIQRTSSDGLSGLSGGGSNFMGAPKRKKGNFLTKTTMILAILFLINSICIAKYFVSEAEKANQMSKKLVVNCVCMCRQPLQ